VQRPGDRGQQDVESEEKVVPVILGALGTIENGLDQNLQLLPRHSSATQVKKITLMTTAHITRKVLG
jgi:hypothetical protein